MVKLQTLLFGLTLTATSLGLSDRLSKPDSKIARNVLEGKSEGYCSPSGPIESTHCMYETVESLNKNLFPALHRLVSYPFFRHYKVDLYKECPFWYDNGLCMNKACGVETEDESEIPEKWRQQALSVVQTSAPGDGISSCYYREQDFCSVEDDANNEGQYVDLLINPERFTGYAGDSANKVWQAIYQENCFGLSEAAIDASKSGTSSAGLVAGAIQGANQGGIGFSKLSEGWGTEMVKAKQEDNEMCEEKRLYYRIISGLHASISIHICHDYLDQSTGEWAPNLECFVNRLATHPERLSNVYFNAVLLLRAVARAAPYLEAYDIGTAPLGKHLDKASEQCVLDLDVKKTLQEVIDLAKSDGMDRGFDEGEFFTGPDAMLLKEQFKTHFRNVSRIMDCVGCDKCRLWGKLQVSGIGTALKILFALDEKALDPKINPDLLQRSEVVALFNVLHRVTESLSAVEDFRRMYAQQQEAAKATPTTARSAKSTARRRKGSGRAKAKKTKSVQSPAEDGRWAVWSTLVGLMATLTETLRRTCFGCLGQVRRVLAKGPLSDWIAWALGPLGHGMHGEL